MSRKLLFSLVFVGAVALNANTISYYTTIYNTNFATADLGLRDVGAGTLNVAGISGTVTNSLLFWHGPTNSASPSVNANVNFNGTNITGTNIGLSQDNFWSSLNSQAYRANVTSLVSGNGNYALSNFQKTDAQINGAALFTFFNTGLTTGKRDVVLYDGNDSNFASQYDPAGWDFTLSNIKYTSGTASLTLYVSDGQNFGPNDDGTIMINGKPLVSGGIFQGLSPRAPGAGVSNGSLTDVETFDVTPFLTPGTDTLHITLGAGVDDAISAVVAAIDLPAGAAPPPPTAPEPGELGLVALGLLAGWKFRNRRKV
jgi:hypothetical protein